MALIKVVNHPLLKGTILYIFYLLIELLPPPIYLMCHGTKRRAKSISKFHKRKNKLDLINLLITVEFHLESHSAKRNILKCHLPHKKKPAISQLKSTASGQRLCKAAGPNWIWHLIFSLFSYQIKLILMSRLIALSQSKITLIFQNKVKPDYYVFYIKNMFYWITVSSENKLLLLRDKVLCSSPAHTHWNKLQRNLQR